VHMALQRNVELGDNICWKWNLVKWRGVAQGAGGSGCFEKGFDIN
jgi:hypothetical protein